MNPPPHGRPELVDRVVRNGSADRARNDTGRLAAVTLDRDAATDLQNLAHGVLTPLAGFHCSSDLDAILSEGRLADGLPWTLPILLPAPEEVDAGPGDAVTLCDREGRVIGCLDVEDAFTWDVHEITRSVFGTDDAGHPGVRRFRERARTGRFLGGPVEVYAQGLSRFEAAVQWPEDTRRIIQSRGWRTVAGFHAHNAPHRGHETLHKVALSLFDGLLVQTALGRKRRGAVRDEVMLDAYEVLVSTYYPADRVLLGALPYETRFAGPREAVHHAIIAKNHGCTHFVVGRDHAGAPGHYQPEAAMDLFNAYPDLGIDVVPVRGDHFYCGLCEGVESERTCAHPTAVRRWFSGTRIRDALARGDAPPTEMMRPEVAALLKKHPGPFTREGE